nr:monocarboxylate transporter 14-like [Procambarus clarkii]
MTVPQHETQPRKGDMEEEAEGGSVKTMPTPPDGGWGWMVVFASFMIHVLADGFTYTFGIYFVQLMQYYDASAASTSWIASILVGVTLGSGPIAGMLVNKMGCRVVTVAGALLASLALFLSIFAPNVETLYVTIGLGAGLGFGLIYLPAIVCVTGYFEKRRSFATGIAVCGSGIGTFAFSPLVEYLINELSWQNSLIIISGIMLNCVVFGAMFRPLEDNIILQRDDLDIEDPTTPEFLPLSDLPIIKWHLSNPDLLITDPSKERTKFGLPKLHSKYRVCWKIPGSGGFVKSRSLGKVISCRSYFSQFYVFLFFFYYSEHLCTMSAPNAAIVSVKASTSSICKIKRSVMTFEKKVEIIKKTNNGIPRILRSAVCSNMSLGKECNEDDGEEEDDGEKEDEEVLKEKGNMERVQQYFESILAFMETSNSEFKPEDMMNQKYLTHRRPFLTITSSSEQRTPVSSTPIEHPVVSLTFLFRQDPGSYRASMARLPNNEETPSEVENAKVCGCVPCSRETRDAMNSLMDWGLLTDGIFILFAISNFCTSIGFNAPYIFIVDRARHLGIPDSQSSFLLAVVGISNTVSRILLGYISDQAWVNRLYLYNVSLTLCGIGTCVSIWFNTYSSQIFYAAVFGSTSGAYVGLTSVVLVDLLGMERLTNAFGLLLMFQGIASVIGPPMCGSLFDMTDSYDYSFLLAGSMIAVSGLMLFFIPCIWRVQARKLAKQASTNSHK